MRESNHPSSPVYSLLCLRHRDQPFESSPISTTVGRQIFVLAAPASCPAPACSCTRGRPGRTSSHGMGTRSPGSAPSIEFAPGANGPIGLHPRCVQIPTTTKYSGLIDRYSLLRVIRRRKRRAQRFRIGDFAIGLADRLQHLRRAIQNPHRPALPLERAHFARRHAGNIGFDRSARGLGAFRRHKRSDKRHGGGNDAGAADHRSHRDRGAAFLVNRLIPKGSPLSLMVVVDMKIPDQGVRVRS